METKKRKKARKLTANGTSHFYTPIPGGFPPDSAVSTPAHSPSPRRHENQMNGHNKNNIRSHQNTSHHNQNNHGRKTNQRNNSSNNNHNSNSRTGTSSLMGSSEEGEDNSSMGGGITADDDEEEDYQNAIIEQLSAIQKPEVTDITSRSAKIIWEAPPCLNETTHQLINMRELRYNVLLSDRAKECKYKSLYKGSSYDCIVQDLQPGQEYVVRLQVHYEHLQGNASEPTEFTTPACEPDQPTPPRLVMRTKNSLHLRWTNPASNGSSIQHYLLEYDEGKSGGPVAAVQSAINFVEAVKTKSKQYIMTKLQPSTVYNFRLAAVNEMGPSLYSHICSYSTADNPPSAPKPPTLQAVSSSSLRVVWERRQSDGAACVYVLQMQNRESGHGYLNMYNGPDCSYECCQLKRATVYYFRLRAENEAGASPWSNEVTYKTAAERPGRPGKPQAKGKIHGTHFRVRWEPPSDNGGMDVQRYFLEINAGGLKFERIYSGVEPETICDRLQPGTTYQLRAACEGPGGISTYSEVSHITSEPIVPAAPPHPYYDNPPGPYAAVLRLEKPEYNGGAPILEFELQLRKIKDYTGSETVCASQIIYKGKDAYCVVKDLQPGCTYEVQLRAINRIGAGAWSTWFRFTSAAAPPNSPEALRVIVKSSTHLHVSWQEPSNCGGAPIIEYRLESATAPAATLTEASTPPPPPSAAFHPCYQGLQTSTDLRNLMPFTLYYFRVNACNMAGVSKWSPMANAQTLAAVPAAPQIKDFEFTSNEATLRWIAPECNGSAITNYSIECADQTITTPDANTEYTIGDLMPETAYKFRVQAVNAIGPGSYSPYAKLTTLPSPPMPPHLECSGVGHNFIKLKWGDGRNLDFTKFYVEMYVQRAKEFQVVYSGTNCMCKVNKLQERTAYTFRICAGNDKAGVGEYSDEFIFSTSTTLPASIKAPRIAQNIGIGGSSSGLNSNGGNVPNSGSSSANSNIIPSGLLPETPSFITGFGNLMLGVPVTLEWQHSKNTFTDRVEYMLQYAIGKDVEFKKIYRGVETKFTIENLEPGGIYQFRVCPIRVTNNGEDLAGAFTTPFRYQVPQLPSLDEIDGNILNNAAAAAGMFASMNANHANGPCHGHAHHHVHHSHHANHHSHHHNPHTHHNSRPQNSTSGSTLHHRSVSASATSGTSSGVGSSNNTSNNNNSNANNSSSNTANNSNTLLIGTAAAANNHLNAVGHHHHHHAQNAGALRRFVTKLSSVYSNRKRFTDQEKAVIFMVSFLFFTFLFATLVKMFMR
uniref:Fibronectin type-III domain-containing protein n=1 Tax=Glossina brevipalpis TaxID=37001 RepID=A0A1A9WLZ3_9MUSC